MNESLQKLNEKFGIDGVVNFTQRNKEIPCMQITSKLATAEISLYGGQILNYKKNNEPPLIWISKHAYFEEGKVIRGGIPVCWPWFSKHPSDDSLPAHGFARRLTWDIEEVSCLKSGEIKVTLSLPCSEKTKTVFPYDFKLSLSVIIGSELHVELITENIGNETFTITDALHTYFNVEDVTNINISGLSNCTYLDAVDSFKKKLQNGDILVNSEVDRVYLNTKSTCVINDINLERKIYIEKQGSNSTVVWNPWIATAANMTDFGNDEFKTMICVETTNAFEDKINIAPGASHSLKAKISSE